MDWGLSILHLAFIYTPGLLWAYIDRTHGNDRDATLGFFLIKLHLFGTLSYLVSILLLLIPWSITYFISKSFEFKVLTYMEPFYFWIIIATSIPVSLMLVRKYLKLNKNQVFTDYLKKHGATIDNYDDELWEHAVSSLTKENGRINLVDSEEQQKYTGIYISSAKVGLNREILFKDAIVSDIDGKQISQAKFIYIF